MHVLLGSTLEYVRAALEGAGHRVSEWDPGSPLPDGAHLAIIDGLEGVVEAHDIPVHIHAIIEPHEAGLFAECPREVTDFSLKPVTEQELVARVARIAGMPSWRERVLHELLAMAVVAASDIVEVTDTSARVEYVNPAFQETLGVSQADARGHTLASLIRSDAHEPAFWRNIGETLERGDAWRGTIVSRAADGRHVHLDSTITPITDTKGHLTHHVAVKRDITERLARREALMQANRALEQARDAAVAASRAKSEFLANMSHELRTPLNAIIGYSEMLMEDFESGDQQVYKDLLRIRGAGSHLLALINDVLDISKIEADKIELDPEEVSLVELVDVVSSTITPLAQKNDNKFEVTCPDDIAPVYADRTRLQQIMLNLLSNACKFTRQGTVELSVSDGERHGDRWIEISVRDDGIGISREQQARLFQPFVQADSSTTREFGGTGLGLAISKRLVDMMHGEISIDSELGKGACFTVRLPGEEEPKSNPVIELAPRDRAPVVLLIDDDPDVRDLGNRMLSKRGFQVQLANTGPEGIELAGLLRPDAIVLDVKMPGMSGWEVLSALKLSEVTAGIPVIMLTVMQQQEVGRALGAVDYLIKPLDPMALTKTLARHIPGARARVLVVEDDEATREIIRRTLERAGHEVDEAEHGQVALSRLGEQPPDIIVLDLMMPVMDGFEFLHHLRGHATCADVPVVVATARVLSASERTELEATAQKIIEKSAHTREELLSLIGDQIAEMVRSEPS